jgi:hypothetical protein
LDWWRNWAGFACFRQYSILKLRTLLPWFLRDRRHCEVICKQTPSSAVETLLAPIHDALKNDAACKKAAADVKAAIKKAQKKK